MKKSRKILAAAGAAVLVLALGAASVFGVSAHAKNEARETALRYLPKDAQLLSQEREDDSYAFKFHSAERKEKYKLEISRKTKELTEWKSQADASAGAKTVQLSQQEAEKIVAGEIAGVKITKSQLVEDDGMQVYEVSFQSDQCRGSYDIHPESGLILEREIKFGAPIVIPLTNAPASQPSAGETGKHSGGMIGIEKARELALAEVPGATVTDIELDRENGVYVYEIELYKDGYEYDLVLSAADGNRVSIKSEKDDWEDDGGWQHHGERTPVTAPQAGAQQETAPQAQKSGSYIGLAKAKEIVLQKAPGAAIQKIELERDDGRISYEGEAVKGNVEYEFDIDAYTGAILSWEEEQKTAAGGAQTSVKISLSQARAIVEKKLPGARIVEIELDTDDGRNVYEGEARKGSMEYDFKVDANTGIILKWEADQAD